MRTSVTVLACLALGASCVEEVDEKPTEEDMKYVKENLLPKPPTPKLPVNADLDGKIVYLGLDTEQTPIELGKDVKLTHYWKVVAAPGDGWRMFTHLSGPNGANNINVDHGPVRGKYPVSQWKAGDIIRDEHTIRLPGNWQHKVVHVHVGIWKGATRMPIRTGPKDSEGRVTAGVIPTASSKAEPPRKRYLARKTTKPPKIDGKLDDPAWKEAASTGAFVNTLTGAPVDQKTEAKLLWDEKFLYLAFDNADTDAWSNLTKRDDKLWTQEAVEIMIDGDRDGKSYIELQVAPNGTILDTYLPEYRKYEDAFDPKRKKFDWSSKLKAAVKVDGTLNKREDQDKSWTVEIALPLEDVKGLAAAGPNLPPSPGEAWRLNLFRMDMPEGKPQQAAAWSPPMVGDFHALDRFGDLVFADEKGNTPPPAARGEPPMAAFPVPASSPAPANPAAAAAAEATRQAAELLHRPRRRNPNELSPGAMGSEPREIEGSGAAAPKK